MLIIIGVAIIAYPFAKEKYQDYKGQQILNEFEKELSLGKDNIDIRFDDSGDNSGLTEEDVSLGNDEQIGSNSATGKVIGIIKIESIDLKLAIVEGTSTKALNSNIVGHMIKTTMPGQEGNCALASHRSITKGRNFNRLNEVKPKDIINIRTKDGEFNYEVIKKYTVIREDTSPLNYKDGDKLLTLITCDPLGVRNPPNRLIVQCKLID